MNLVIGATGMLGSDICARMARKEMSVRALVRTTVNPDKLAHLKELGCEIYEGDLRDRASLKNALHGVSSVISTASSMPFSYQPGENDIQTVDLNGFKDLVEAAALAHVDHFIYTSLSGGMDLDYPLRNAKREIENQLKESGLVYTILRPSYFMEAWLSPVVGFDFPNAKAQIFGTGERPISWISYEDVAKFAVACLNNPAARNKTYELGGPETLTSLQAVKIFEQVGGRVFDLQFVSEADLLAQQQAASDPMQQSFSGLMRCVAQGDPIDMQATLAEIPIELTSVNQYANRQLVVT